MDYKKLSEAIRMCGSTPNIEQCKSECPYYAGGDMTKCIPRMTKDAADAIKMFQEKKVNVNDYVWVKLTEYGKYKLSEHSRVVNKFYGVEVLNENPWETENGYEKVQLWEFMNVLGSCFSMGLLSPIAGNMIYFENPNCEKDCKNEKND